MKGFPMTGKRLSLIFLIGPVALAFGFLKLERQARAQGPQVKVDFVKEIQPIFQRACYSCHGAKRQMAGLRLDSKKLAFAGGQSGKIIIPGKAAESLLYQRVAGLGDQAQMPLGGEPLDAATIALIRAWIEQGAEWPEEANAAGAEMQKHWAYVAPTRPELPKVKNASWVRNPVDRFILARLEKEGLSPAPEADRITLLRRLSLD
ncbi:MAG TPA: c-type cytochrome domain-containing protein, partial [Blastocatellia bacterium]|nr:c-type cytochrome domain-containing protein [Blastocatellia bacterium]